MANSDSALISKTVLLPAKNYKKRTSKNVKKITPHHAAGINATIEGMAKTWSGKAVSANYGIESNGTIGLFVHEKDQAYTSCNGTNDGQAITIEIANCKGAPNWEVSDAAVKSLILLSVDICKRNGMPGLTWTGKSNGTLTVHRMFKATACPGPYLMALMPWIAAEVSARVAGTKSGDIIIPKVPGMDPGSKTPKTPVTPKPVTPAPVKPVTPTPAPAQPAAPTPSITKSYVYQGVDFSLVYDYKYYSTAYQDVVAAAKKNNLNVEDFCFQHFCNCGMKEHRQAKSTFNAVNYRNRYKDLNNLYGDNWTKYYVHYCTCGAGEGRIGC